MNKNVYNYFYNQTPKERKRIIIKNWMRRGLKFSSESRFKDAETLFAEYQKNERCEACGSDYTNTKRCMDHCHKSGEFRFFLCTKCNNFDNWKIHIRNSPHSILKDVYTQTDISSSTLSRQPVEI
jgi:hypothetical protein